MLYRLVVACVFVLLSITVGIVVTVYTLTKPVPARTVNTTFNQSEIRFVALGDFGTGNLRQWQVAWALNDVARTDGLDFIATVGDNFYSYGVRHHEDLQWQYKFENVYSGEALENVPFFATLGNHDYDGNEMAQLVYSERELGSGRWKMPAKDYVRHFGEVAGKPLLRVVFLDSSPSARRYEYTALELDKLLRESEPAIWTAVVTHTPIRSARDFYSTEQVRNALLPVLNYHDVHAYFAGHDHNLQVLSHASEPLYIISGAGGKHGQRYNAEYGSQLKFAASSLGFAHVTVNQGTFTVKLMNDKAETLYAAKLNSELEVASIFY